MPRYDWQLEGHTCEAGGSQPIRLRLGVTVCDAVLTALTLSAEGPGITCGAKWSPIWAQRAVEKLGWIGKPINSILAEDPPPDPYGCACTEISLAPKLWRLLESAQPSAT